MALAHERFSEKRWSPPWVRHQHVTRYQWVTQFTVGRRVIDTACGTGYGAKMLLDGGARDVLAFDRSPKAIEEAQRFYSSDRLLFRLCDAVHLPVSDASC